MERDWGASCHYALPFAHSRVDARPRSFVAMAYLAGSFGRAPHDCARGSRGRSSPAILCVVVLANVRGWVERIWLRSGGAVVCSTLAIAGGCHASHSTAC